MSECAGKYPFITQEQADKAIFGLWVKDPSLKVGDLHVYRCRRCRKYHVGHTVPRAIREQTARST